MKEIPPSNSTVFPLRQALSLNKGLFAQGSKQEAPVVQTVVKRENVPIQLNKMYTLFIQL